MHMLTDSYGLLRFRCIDIEGSAIDSARINSFRSFGANLDSKLDAEVVNEGFHERWLGWSRQVDCLTVAELIHCNGRWIPRQVRKSSKSTGSLGFYDFIKPDTGLRCLSAQFELGQFARFIELVRAHPE